MRDTCDIKLVYIEFYVDIAVSLFSRMTMDDCFFFFLSFFLCVILPRCLYANDRFDARFGLVVTCRIVSMKEKLYFILGEEFFFFTRSRSARERN